MRPWTERKDTMEPFIIFAVAIGGLLAFDLAALRWGADSRPGLTDDHRR